MTVDAGQTLKLDVEVEGCPEPRVKWYKDGKEVNTDARIKIERDTKRLDLISNVKFKFLGLVYLFIYLFI